MKPISVAASPVQRLQRLNSLVLNPSVSASGYEAASDYSPHRRHLHVSGPGERADAAVVRTSVASSPPQPHTLKPFSAMPGPRGYPVIGSLWDYLKKDGYKFTKMFEAMQDLSARYGPVYRERIGLIEHVVVSDPAEYAKVIRADSRTPERIGLLPMEYHRKKRGLSLGLVNGQGEEWYRHRHAVNQKMLRPKEVLDHVPEMNIVADDFMERLKRLRTSQGHVENLEKEMFKWAMESIGTVLFSERLGCLNEPPPARAQEFIRNLVGFFTLMQPLMYNVPVYRLYRTKTWKQYEEYANNVIAIGNSYVQKKLEKIEQQREWGVQPGEREHKAEFLTFLITQKSLSPDEANLLAVDLLTGAVETTSNAILWTLYNLSTNPKAQKALFREISEVLPDRAPITVEVLPKLPYVKACLKETFRLYPITFATSRIIDKDIELGGYFVPKGTHCQANLYGMGRDPKLFPNPLEFQPERWLRAEEEAVSGYNLSLANLPWGHGARMCIGRRFAEQEIYINVIKFVQNFRLEYHEKPLNPVLNTVMIPDRKVKLTFIPRD